MEVERSEQAAAEEGAPPAGRSPVAGGGLARRWVVPGAVAAVLVLVGLWAMFGPGSREANESWYWWLFWLVAPFGSVVGLYFAYYFYHQMMAKDEGTERMREIAAAVRQGAWAYIRRQYTVVGIVFAFLVAILALVAFGYKAQSRLVPFAFLTGGFFSGLCGYLGMKAATYASARTANAARHSLNAALQIALRSGAVLGLVVVGFGLLDICIWFFLLKRVAPLFGQDLPLEEVTVIMLCFGMGASTQALFARLGGGIYTKAADVGADLVGKVEAGIPEDDPRNPATIADQVGDNVGDVAGMGADLYESYCGSILAAAALGVAAGLNFTGAVLPMMLAGIGVVLSVVGIFAVRSEEQATQDVLLRALRRGVWLSSALIVVASFLLIWLLLRGQVGDWGALGIWLAVLSGLASGVVVGYFAERYTSDSYAPTRATAEQALTGPATVILDGIASGMRSTGVTAVAVAVAMFLAYMFSGGFSHPEQGLYGVGLAAVGMLSTLGITLATDAYGPIADNAGGNAQMSDLPAEVRERTDALDAMGNTTAATGKGFAIGSAVLTALALLAAYVEELRAGLIRANIPVPTGASFDTWRKARLGDLAAYYDISLLNIKVLVGLVLGAMLTFLFCSMAIKAVGRAARKMVEEVRRQFHTIAGIMEGTTKPDYARCVQISVSAAQREMVLPSLMAISLPVVVGVILGPGGVMGVLAGGLSTGFVLAVTLNNAGATWDNAKKYIEKGNLGGKGSAPHKAAVVGDTVGDPFKDTAGPCLNIIIKLVSMVAIVFAGVVVKLSPVVAQWLHIGR